MGSAKAKAMGMNISPGSAESHQNFDVGFKLPGGKTSIQANKYAGKDMAGFLKDLHDAGAPLTNFSGTYNYRQKRGGGGFSQHAYGNAMDIETGFGSGPDNSPALFKWAQAHPKEFAQIQAAHHMKNLTHGDWGHFEWTPEGLKKVDTAQAPGAKVASLDPTSGVPSAPGAGGNDAKSRLAAMRGPLWDEVNKDPATKQLLHGMLAREGDPKATSEALFNRVAMIRKSIPDYSIKEELHSGFYSTVKSGLAGRTNVTGKELEQQDKALAEVMAGSNVTQGRDNQGLPTDSGGNNPGNVHQPGSRQVFNYWEGRRRGRNFGIGQSAAFASEVNAPADRAALNDNNKIHSTGKLDVSVNAPPGTKVNYHGKNLLKNTAMQRQTQMMPTSSGPNVADTAQSYMRGGT